VWQAWGAHPDDERWELLARWRGPTRVAEAACDAAMTDGSDEVTAFCIRKRLAPADPVRRAVFFALTGQAAQLRAADADGSLLALGYSGAAGPERAKLRAAMAGSGDPDLVAVVARGGPRPPGSAKPWPALRPAR
jgi:hypothetical protein